jgi:hypothetical protein
MKTSRLAGLIAAVLLFGMGSAPAADKAESDYARLLNAKTLRCTFDSGVTAIFESAQPKVEQFVADPRPRTRGDRVTKATDPVYFDAIDYRASTARLIAQLGSKTVGACPTAAGVYFVEEFGLGGIEVTFVFHDRAAREGFIAVATKYTSFGLLPPRTPVIEQAHGTCKVWQ